MKEVSLDQGLKKTKEKWEKEISKELLQLHLKSTFRSLTEGDLTNKEKYAALELLMFLKEKLRWEHQGMGMRQQREAAARLIQRRMPPNQRCH